VTVVRQQVKRKEMEYTLNEYCGMYLMLGACDNWANVAARECVERYPACDLVNTNVCHWLDHRMRESGRVLLTSSVGR
jgi:hypothetical protein